MFRFAQQDSLAGGRPERSEGAFTIPFFEISKDSRDHSPEVYSEVIMPGFRAMRPAPKIGITRFGPGGHIFWKAEKDLPAGIVPSVLKSWDQAVRGGYFL